MHGIDWNGPILEDGDNQVDIPDVRNPLEVQDFQHMQDLIYPLAQSECFGVDNYIFVFLNLFIKLGFKHNDNDDIKFECE